mgnify:CR=1 FL=1
MITKLLTASAFASAMIAVPALAQVERHQNPSLNGYVGFATDAQSAGPTAFRTASTKDRSQAVGAGNPSRESFNPNAVNGQPTRFQSAPSVVENPDFDWIDQPDIGT